MRDRKKKIRLNLTVSRDNYENFKKLAYSLGLSASLLMDILMHCICKYSDEFEKYIKEIDSNIFGRLVQEVKEQFGDKIKKEVKKE